MLVNCKVYVMCEALDKVYYEVNSTYNIKYGLQLTCRMYMPVTVMDYVTLYISEMVVCALGFREGLYLLLSRTCFPRVITRLVFTF